MANECCFGDRPPAEKLRNLCITCLVFDAIFLLINALYTLSSTSATVKSACYEAHGYTWHNLITLSFAISTAVAASGILVHSAISCGSKVELFQIANITRFTYVLIVWTFLSAVMESIAYNEEPEMCKDPSDGHITDHSSELEEQVAEAEASKHALWQIVYTMLSLAWFTSTAVASIFGRRLARSMQGGASTANELTQPPAETVGSPVTFGDSVVGSPVEGGSWPGGGDGGAAFPGVVVAQGRPVPGSTHDPDRPAQAGAKVVD